MTTVSLSNARVGRWERLRFLFVLPLAWLSRARRRRELMSLLGQPEHVLKDLGLQRDEITREGLKPFWRA
jgi:uncharacterized protein YjiS (DUF1127 family)